MTATRQQATINPMDFRKYTRFEVAFRALDRVCETMPEAVAYCNRCDFDPAEIYPVVVAYEAPRPMFVPCGDRVEIEPYHVFDFGRESR